jgi:NAD(P)H-nitrite reductase large subunit
VNHLIIGCGVAGQTAAETIRGKDKRAEISIVCGEGYPFYYRTALSFFLKGRISEEEVIGKPAGWYEEHNIRLVYGRVTAVDPRLKQVSLNNGQRLGYDKLLIATGARPIKFPWPGVELGGICTYRTLDCAKRLLTAIQEVKAKQAVVVGGGILGIELVEDLVNMGLKVSLLVRKDMLANLLLDRAGADIIQRQMEREGVEIHYQDEVEEFQGQNGWVTQVLTKKGNRIPCQIVGIAVGVQPNIEFLEGSGIELNRAVLVDEFLRTNLADVYAAGDVCAVYSAARQRHVPTRTWLVSALQGKTAGLNMLGEQKTCDGGGCLLNSSHLFRSRYAVVGNFKPRPEEGCEELVCPTEAESYNKLIIKDDRLVGAIFIDDLKNVWPIKRLIDSGAAISPIRSRLCQGGDLKRTLPPEYSLLY